MRSNSFDGYIFVVDTDMYAGNFERELCAYMTGVIGECGVGEEAKKLYEKDGFEPLEDLICSVADEHGTFRPASIMPSPDWFNDGHGNHYRRSSYNEDEVLRKRNLNIEEYAKKTEVVYADKSYGKKEADRQRESIYTKLEKYPAYVSVGIFMTRKPTLEEIRFLKERAQKFVSEVGKKSRFDEMLNTFSAFKIEGFRLIREEVVQKEETV